MTTIIPFVPSNITLPTIPMQLDGSDYTITVSWNVSAQRYYVDVYDSDGTWIITTPLVSSPPARSIKRITYDPFLNINVVEMVSPDLWPAPLSPAGLATPPGKIIDYTILGCSPDTYNGKFRCLHLNETTFTLPMPANPGPMAILGTVNRMLDLIEPLFNTSTLVYRNSAFEINP